MPVKVEKLKDLKKELPYKWRVQTQSDFGATCVAYIDARIMQDHLDDVVGPENWQINYSLIDGQMFAAIGINIEHPDGKTEWVWKSDTGTESKTEAEKGQVSDAAKRAAVVWGVGRFLYGLGIKKLKTTKHTNGKIYPCSDDGKILWDGEEITNFITSKLSNKNQDKKKETKQQEKKEEVKTVENTKKYGKPQTDYSTVSYSQETIDKVNNLDKNGHKGKACLINYLEDFNKKFNTSYKKISELNTDELLNKLISFIDDIQPSNI